MKEQILAQLKIKYSGVSATLLGLMADSLTAKVTSEEQIEGVLDELDRSPISITDYANLLQRESDRRVTEAVNKVKKSVDAGKPPVGAVERPMNDSNTEVDDLKAKYNEMQQTLASIVKEKQAQTIQSQIENKLKDKNIPAILLKGRVPQTVEEIDTVVVEIEADWKMLAQSNANNGLGGMNIPLSGSDKSHEMIEKEIKSWAEKPKEN